MNKLAGRKGFSLDYVGEGYGIFATHLAEDNTNSSLRIEGLYDSSQVVLALVPPSLIISLMPCTLLWKVFAQSCVTRMRLKFATRSHLIEGRMERA